ncbi:MAG TPA: HD domain-containing protein [Deltaproteobacteria bacterium]|nr:HD domain-containing protein [Deltaproteobacteria bacterium]
MSEIINTLKSKWIPRGGIKGDSFSGEAHGKTLKSLIPQFVGFVSIVGAIIFLIHRPPFKIDPKYLIELFYIPLVLSCWWFGRKSFLLPIPLLFGLVAAQFFGPYATISNMPKELKLAYLGIWYFIATFLSITAINCRQKVETEDKTVEELQETINEYENQVRDLNLEIGDYLSQLREYRTSLAEKENTILDLQNKIEEVYSTTLAPEVARLMFEGKLRNEKRRCSVLFADIADFTLFSEDRHPEEIVGEINEFLKVIEPVIDNYNGTIDKYLGDGILCEFGIPSDYVMHPLQAILAAIELQEAIRKLKVDWEMRIGISTGYAITGVIGHLRKTYTAIGSVVNLAARLQEICKPGSIYIDEETYYEVNRFFRVKRVRLNDEDEEDTDYEQLREKLAKLIKRIKSNPRDVDAFFEAGKIYFELKEPSKASCFFKQALALDPDNPDIKLAYADANMFKDRYEKVALKGKKTPLAVFEVIGLKDPLHDRTVIPEKFYQKYNFAEGFIQIPKNVVLPVEAIDGSIGHAIVVAVLCYALADCFKLNETRRRNLLLAGYLLDLGKKKISPHLLNRKGTLTELELAEIRLHPEESVDMAKKLGINDPEILRTILEHHEYLDGSGYPFQKRGEQISLGGRIAAVADMYAALTAWRPYRERWEKNSALEEIEKSARLGRLDRRVVDHLKKLLSE